MNSRRNFLKVAGTTILSLPVASSFALSVLARDVPPTPQPHGGLLIGYHEFASGITSVCREDTLKVTHTFVCGTESITRERHWDRVECCNVVGECDAGIVAVEEGRLALADSTLIFDSHPGMDSVKWCLEAWAKQSDDIQAGMAHVNALTKPIGSIYIAGR